MSDFDADAFDVLVADDHKLDEVGKIFCIFAIVKFTAIIFQNLYINLNIDFVKYVFENKLTHTIIFCKFYI